jgi:thiol-disulfide isomerase/thioredoxin
MSEANTDWSDTEADPPKPRQISWLWLFLVVIVVGLFLQLRGGRSGAPGGATTHPAVGRELPDLRLQALTGNSQDLTLADLKGEVVVIDFWGPWCHWCVVEFPELAAMWGELRSREHFRFLPVSCPAGDESDVAALRRDTAEFLEQRQSQLPTYADEGMVTRRNLAMVLGEAGFGYPTTIVLDQNGVIRAVWVGYDPRIGDEIKQIVNELLAAKP